MLVFTKDCDAVWPKVSKMISQLFTNCQGEKDFLFKAKKSEYHWKDNLILINF